MLNTFNELLKNIISEQSNMINLYKSNEFFLKYIDEVALKNKVCAVKQAEDVFVIAGTVSNVVNFFNDFKVDKYYMNDPENFVINSPMFTFGENNHKLNIDEKYPISNNSLDVTTLSDLSNFTGSVIEGPWFSFKMSFENEIRDIKDITPKKLSMIIKNLFKGSEHFIVYVCFEINVEQMPNNTWKEDSEWAHTPEKMNELNNKEPDDFEYNSVNCKSDKNSEDPLIDILKSIQNVNN